MVIRLGSTVINCADMDLMTGFWSQALHLTPSSQAAGMTSGCCEVSTATSPCSYRAPRSPPGTRCTSHLYTDTRPPRSSA